MVGRQTRIGLVEAVHRGYNLLACSVLGLAGLAFGSVVFDEAEWTDKIDDIVLLGVAVVALVWYLSGQNRFRRTVVPIVLTVIATLGQLAGVFLEHDDAGAFGDNIGGMLIYVPLLVLLIVQYVVTARLAAPGGLTAGSGRGVSTGG